MTVNLDTWSDYKSLKFWKKENFRYITVINLAFETVKHGAKELRIAVLGFHFIIEWHFNDC